MNTVPEKLYIAVLDQVSDYMVPTLVAHTILNADSAFANNNEYILWKRLSFKKVVIKVNKKEFEKIKTLEKVFLGYENTTLEGTFSCAILCPRAEYPNVIKFAKLWQPKPPEV